MSDIVTLNGYKIKDEKAVRSYETVALMKADTKLKEGYHVKTKGYYEANDGGHGEYVIVDDETLVDDGGSIHVLTNGLRAKLIENNKISVKQFGAYGDNTHDDTLKLQQAINLAENTNGYLIIDKGQYKISDELIINKAIKINGEYERGLTGDSLVYGTQINQITEGKSIFKNNTNNSFYGLEIAKLRLNGNKGIALDFRTHTAFSEFIFEKIHFNGGFDIAIDISGSIGRISDCDIAVSDIGINLTCVNVTINNNNFWNNNIADIKFSSVSRDCFILNNWFEKTVQTGSNLLFQAPSNVQKCVIENNSFQSTRVPSVLFDGITNITDIMRFIDLKFVNCRFNATNTHSIKVDMKNQDNVQNSNGSNSSNIRFDDCEFDTVDSYAIETDYPTLYWGLINCNAYSNYGYGSATLKDETFTSNITYSKIGRRLETNSALKFFPLITSSYAIANCMYLEQSSNLLAFKDNNNTARYFQYILSGSTSNRPSSPKLGTCYFDTTLGKPIWYNQNTQWVDSTGTIV